MKIICTLTAYAIFNIVGNVYAQDSTSIDRHLVLFRTYDRRTVHFENLPADTAVYFTSQALRIARKNGYQLGQVRMLCRLADINEHYGNLAMSVKCQTEAIQIAQHSVQKITFWQMSARMAVLTGKQGDVKTAKVILLQVLENFKRPDQSQMSVVPISS